MTPEEAAEMSLAHYTAYRALEKDPKNMPLTRRIKGLEEQVLDLEAAVEVAELRIAELEDELLEWRG
jgi:hypothetical protein